jgi:hypothetical protein
MAMLTPFDVAVPGRSCVRLLNWISSQEES